ncbi:response regulator [Aliarcobacter butzleri]|uniref:response regulator n=1 Tax=Aliarcobacter butzleri TaxID=28197 RepID=UPI0021B1F325|nr:response regulator [Aliarcobacter butzleri]MCT7609736.1 response regulator [Aliarcobacter butzleri]
MIKILIVEDETIVALDTKSTLIKLGYEITDIVTNYDDAISSFLSNKPDIILMDIFLKNSLSGIEISKKINEIENTPIIFMSAYCDDETLSQAAEIEPFGYLVKPFNRNDLKSTMNIVVYKLQKKSTNNYLSDGKIRIANNYFYSLSDYLKIYYENQEIELTKNERLFLEVLISAKGELVTFSDIEHYIWFNKTVSDSTLRTLIYRLRSKLNHKIIETISSLGCRINMD